MASWDVQDLLKEVADMEVISMRNPGSDLVQKMKQALVSKIECTQLITPSNYVKIMDCLEKNTLHPDIKRDLSTCIESKCAAGVQGPAKLMTTPQSMTMPWNYLCQSEWQKLQSSGCTNVEATSIIIKRIKLCGLKSLKEDTKKYITAFLVAFQQQTVPALPPAHEMYKLSQFVHDSFVALDVQPLFGGLAQYPPSPFDLGDAYVLMKKYVCSKNMYFCKGCINQSLQKKTWLLQRKWVYKYFFTICKQLQAFFSAVYSSDDQPLKAAPEFVSNVATIAKQIKVRASSKELSRVVVQPTGSSTNLPSGISSSSLDQMMSMNSRLMTLIFDKAKVLDEIMNQKVQDPGKAALSKGDSSSSLGSNGASLLSPKALPTPAEAVPLPLPAPSSPVAPTANEDGSPGHNDQQKPSKSLEDYENEAFHSLGKRKAKSLDKCMKRPAACKAKAGPKPQAKTKPQPSASSKSVALALKKGIFGCIRCRGNVNGCSTCQNLNFSGLRFSSREEWVAWKQQQDKCK